MPVPPAPVPPFALLLAPPLDDDPLALLALEPVPLVLGLEPPEPGLYGVPGPDAVVPHEIPKQAAASATTRQVVFIAGPPFDVLLQQGRWHDDTLPASADSAWEFQIIARLQF
jgi:hypothetical protein